MNLLNRVGYEGIDLETVHEAHGVSVALDPTPYSSHDTRSSDYDASQDPSLRERTHSTRSAHSPHFARRGSITSRRRASSGDSGRRSGYREYCSGQERLLAQLTGSNHREDTNRGNAIDDDESVTFYVSYESIEQI